MCTTVFTWCPRNPDKDGGFLGTGVTSAMWILGTKPVSSSKPALIT